MPAAAAFCTAEVTTTAAAPAFTPRLDPDAFAAPIDFNRRHHRAGMGRHTEAMDTGGCRRRWSRWRSRCDGMATAYRRGAVARTRSSRPICQELPSTVERVTPVTVPPKPARTRCWRRWPAASDADLDDGERKCRSTSSCPGRRRCSASWVRTEPAGARVSVDGVARGTSPVTVTDLTPSRPGARKRPRIGEADAGRSGRDRPLDGPARLADGRTVSGWIAVTAPTDVQVFENHRLLGTSQSDRLMVSSGRHDIEIVNETLGYRTARTVQVSPGKVTPIKIDYPKGTIALNAVPWAEVWVDGEKVGDTPIGNLSLVIGPHEIVFRHPDLGEQRHAATVTLNSPARLSVDLRKK
jgi:hypothetical protein